MDYRKDLINIILDLKNNVGERFTLFLLSMNAIEKFSKEFEIFNNCSNLLLTYIITNADLLDLLTYTDILSNKSENLKNNKQLDNIITKIIIDCYIKY